MKKYNALSKSEEDRALELHRKSYVINGLAGVIGHDLSDGIRFFDVMREGGVTAVNITVGSAEFLDAVTFMADLFRAFDIVGRGRFFSAESAEDIRRAKRTGAQALVFGLQDTMPLYRKAAWRLENISWLEVLHKLGVRIVQLTYQKQNLVGCGCGEVVASGKDCGLSSYGVQVVEEMNRLGILVDLSHCGHQTTMEAIELSKAPPAFTHTNARAIRDQIRCKTDEEIEALAEKGGVTGITAISKFIRPRDAEGNIVPASMDEFIDHIEHVADLVGVDHVGIGTDIVEFRKAEDDATLNLAVQESGLERLLGITPDFFSPKDAFIPERHYVEGVPSIAKSLNITRGLVARGYSDQEIEKILGGNFLRLFERVWRS